MGCRVRDVPRDVYARAMNRLSASSVPTEDVQDDEHFFFPETQMTNQHSLVGFFCRSESLACNVSGIAQTFRN